MIRIYKARRCPNCLVEFDPSGAQIYCTPLCGRRHRGEIFRKYPTRPPVSKKVVPTLPDFKPVKCHFCAVVFTPDNDPWATVCLACEARGFEPIKPAKRQDDDLREAVAKFRALTVGNQRAFRQLTKPKRGRQRVPERTNYFWTKVDCFTFFVRLKAIEMPLEEARELTIANYKGQLTRTRSKRFARQGPALFKTQSNSLFEFTRLVRRFRGFGWQSNSTERSLPNAREHAI